MTSMQHHNLSLALAASELKQPLHVKVRHLLRERILADFKHNQRFYSERGLMQKLAVSQATVRRAIMDLVDEGYLRADPRRGFFVRLVEGPRYVSLIAPTVGGSRQVHGQSELMAACREREWIFNTYGFHKHESAADIMRLLQHKPSEERILMSGLTVDLTLKLGLQLKAAGYRHVLIGPHILGFSGDTVVQDHGAEVQLVLEHLTALGHRRILFMVNEPKDLLITNLRAEKVRQKLAEHNLPEARLVFCDTPNWTDSFAAAYKKIHAIMQTPPTPTAVVPLSGVGAWAVLRYALEHGLKVPQQLSIVGFDPLINADLLPIPLTELSFSMEERVSKALDLLWSGETSPQHTLIAPKLVVRASTAAPGR
ncbi:MAG: GntR family transcriptional regulator [Verrucomicrobiales bacterium]|jgi:LacI family transcriptional regulator|nr:GntR family transcriptional regulator [Verrucomicrobiales bacterium]